MRRVMRLAEYPAKLIERNPIPANAMPRTRTEVALQWLYPNEDVALLRCVDVNDDGKAKMDPRSACCLRLPHSRGLAA